MLNVSTGSWRSHTFRRLCNGSATLSWARADFLHERRLGLRLGLGLGLGLGLASPGPSPSPSPNPNMTLTLTLT